ncbi:alpha/beta hydrolase fold domain-containing protein [Actinacidiphila sp. DG2A-62]|uniref:alpha/beta hydrolase fold domain-containing protein n=1 Tax=Actinacidiphila sp. DG2A-62 TaxID=3108821 RepID=UPI002DC02337|nr:alpha/beta hydrolase fold domain-containing protein [Actinacidiphila sp. DG2A-62]MEC3993748.1 alpha/beta hydrolase fold domain-containing protein [Actinacidiphila sp. DG2A-62]
MVSVTEADDDYERLRAERLSRIPDRERTAIERWPDLAEIGVSGVRALISGSPRRPAHPGVAVRDVEVEGPGGPVPVRIHTPPHEDGERLPVVVHTHGGGFVAGGGLDMWDASNSALAAAVPAVVVHPDFRLPPEHPFPAGLEDNWAVLNWVAGGGDRDAWDTSRIAIGGGCSGANMAAALALMARDAGGPDIALQWLQAWPADLRNDTRSQAEYARGYGLRKSDNDFVTAQYLDRPETRWDWRASPLLAESVRGVAPALIWVGEWDILRDEDVRYADRLRDAGVPVELHVDPEQGHVVADPGPATARLVACLQRAFGLPAKEDH